MPDFDIDFCMEGRDRVIEYVANTYGRASVSQIITYGTMAARAVVRDVGRVLGLGYGFVDQLAKLVPFEIGMTLKKALQDEPLLLERYHEDSEVNTLLTLALKLEGIPRNVGKHAGGVVIAPSLLTDFTPLYCEEGGGNLVTQFDKDDVETVGLVKFDFLGLRTLTIIDWALKTINDKIDITEIPLDDVKTFDLLKACQTTAVFQLESRGMKDLVKRLQPDCFDDIVALVALFRPGPLQSGMVDDYVDCKHGRQEVVYAHPALEPLLKETYGVILYQEQVMQIAQVLAGYSLGNADLLRRAMGKKKPEEMAKHRTWFVDGAHKNNIDGKTSNYIFDLMEKFAGYGFNKSHSAAYALIAYQTAWLKAHYPAEFMSAVLSSDMDNTEKVVRFIEDCKEIGLTVLHPNINQSYYKFTVNEQGEIVYGLGAIKGVGEAALESILEVRESSGAYKNLFEFCQKVDTRKANRKVLEALIKSTTMDVFKVERSTLMASVDKALKAAEQHSQNLERGQSDLFGAPLDEGDTQIEYKEAPPWPEDQRLRGEKDTLGMYLSGHPYTRYKEELLNIISAPLKELKPEKDKTILAAGMISQMRIVNTKKGDRMAILQIEDGEHVMDVVIFSRLFETCRHKLQKDQIYVIVGEASNDDFSDSTRLTAEKVYELHEAREIFTKKLKIHIRHQEEGDVIKDLQQVLLNYKGGFCPVTLSYQNDKATAELTLSKEWMVSPKEALLVDLNALSAVKKTEVLYS